MGRKQRDTERLEIRPPAVVMRALEQRAQALHKTLPTYCLELITNVLEEKTGTGSVNAEHLSDLRATIEAQRQQISQLLEILRAGRVEGAGAHDGSGGHQGKPGTAAA